MESKQVVKSSATPTSPLSQLDSSGALTLNLTIPASDLVLGNKLGQGAYGTVWKAKWRNKDVAVKQLLLPNPSEQEKNEFKQEAAVMFQIATDSDHVVRLHKITLQPQLSLVMELMPNGSLYELLQNNRDKPLDWGIRYRLAMDISTGLEDIHSHSVLHRDLKSLNVLLDGNLRAKLTDFGLATTKLTSSRHSSVQGTPHWMAPEVANGEPDSQGSDVYSLGMVLFELAAHRHPYPNLKPMQVLLQVSQGKQETIPDDCPITFKQLILDCWTVSEKRPKAVDITTRLRSMLDSKETSSTPAAGGVVLDSLTSTQLKGSADYQIGAAPTAPHRSAVLQQTPAVLSSVSLVSTPHYQPQSPTPSTPPATSQTTAGSKLLEDKAFQTGYALYHQGQYLQALPHLRQAAKAGYAPAYIDLGVMHELGLGVDKEVDEATIWYKKAQRSESWFEQQADTEEAMAQFYLGRYYQFAAGSKKDGLEASGWYRRAAKQGHAEAQCSLGDCYANGIGVNKDLTQAKQWYEKAAAQGNVRAKAQLAALQPASVVSHPTPSTNTPSSFFAASNPPKPDNKVEAKQAINNPPLAPPKPIPEKSAAPVVVDEKALGQLLKFVAEGEQDQAEALIKKDSKLLLATGKVTDLSGRTFDNITAFQYALWAMDYHMWTMIQKYLPTEAQAKQHAMLESKGTAHGKHFDLQPLLDALRTYVDNYRKWRLDQRKEQWCKKVGGAQKLLPAHVVNEYCRPDRPFDPCPSEWSSSLPRARAVLIGKMDEEDTLGAWFSPPSSSELLGSSFAFVRSHFDAACGREWSYGSPGLFGMPALADLESLQALWNARTQQLKLLADTLVVESQSTMQVGLK
jgi:serine/threonine protein kinase